MGVHYQDVVKKRCEWRNMANKFMPFTHQLVFDLERTEISNQNPPTLKNPTIKLSSIAPISALSAIKAR